MLRLLATSIVAMTPVALPAYADGPAPSQLDLKATSGAGAPHNVTLQCDPEGGTHPRATQACADLVQSHGEISATTRDKDPRACFMIYAPVTVSAEGTWQGRNVHFQSKYPNTCALRSKTGSIFDF
jgi:Subtilisin inhibitor-like